MNGFLQTVNNYTGVSRNTLFEWKTRNRIKKSHALITRLYRDIEKAQTKVMERWMQNPKFVAVIEKAKARKPRTKK